MKKVFLYAIICITLISKVFASSDVAAQEQSNEKYSIALQKLCVDMQMGPHAIDPVTIDGDLRGYTFRGFDESLYTFFKSRVFQQGQGCRLLDYACGTGRWAANAVLQAEMDKVKLDISAIDPFMQADHATYYNEAWTKYIQANVSNLGSLFIQKGWLKDLAASDPKKYNTILVRDAIHFFTPEQIVELFQLGSTLTETDGSIVLHATPAFAPTLWSPAVQTFLEKNNLQQPNFEEIFFNKGNYRTYLEAVTAALPADRKFFKELSKKSVCLPAIRDVANTNGWWLQAIQVGNTIMTHTIPLTEEQLYNFVSEQFQKYKPHSGESDMNCLTSSPSIIMHFKKQSEISPTPAN